MTLALVVLFVMLAGAAAFQSQRPQRLSTSQRGLSSVMSTPTLDTSSFLKDVAKTAPPKRLGTLLKLLDLDEKEELVNPDERTGLCPFLIPLSKNKETGQYLCYIRWPTQKEDMDLQLVRTTDVGVVLEGMGTDQYCHRKVVERDFLAAPDASEMIKILNMDGQMYSEGDYMSFLKSGKFDVSSEEGKNLVLDRYLLTKVGAFPDSFERLATNFLKTGSDVSALVTCERAVSVFYGWGHPLTFHAMMLNGIPERGPEAKDCARAAMGLPAWTVAKSEADLSKIIEISGYKGGKKFLGEMHLYRSNDPREDEVGEGLSPIQVTLDQVAHYMDAISLGAVEGGWEASKAKISDMYREGGYPEMADFILT